MTQHDKDDNEQNSQALSYNAFIVRSMHTKL